MGAELGLVLEGKDGVDLLSIEMESLGLSEVAAGEVKDRGELLSEAV